MIDIVVVYFGQKFVISCSAVLYCTCTVTLFCTVCYSIVVFASFSDLLLLLLGRRSSLPLLLLVSLFPESILASLSS